MAKKFMAFVTPLDYTHFNINGLMVKGKKGNKKMYLIYSNIFKNYIVFPQHKHFILLKPILLNIVGIRSF